MFRWDLYEFYGAVPRLKGKQQQHGYASVAHNVDLTHGTLKPFYEKEKVAKVKSDSVKFYQWGCDTLGFSKCVSVAKYIPDCPRLFVTGNAPYPQVATFKDGGLVYHRLGVPTPEEPPKVQATNKETDKSRSVAYVVTFVNSLGEESAPSLPTVDVVIEDRDLVKLTFDYSPRIEYGVEKIFIYRRESGYRSGDEAEQELVTNWFKVGEVGIDSSEFKDTLSMSSVGHGLDTQEVKEPPTNIKHITAIDDTATIVGSVGNVLHFSENFRPYSFPTSQQMTLDDNVAAIASQGEDLYVATDGFPYRIQASNGCDDRSCRTVYKYDSPHPMVSCHTGRGHVVTPMGMVYASTTGLVLLSHSSVPIVISSSVFSEDDWRNLAPHTMRMVYYRGTLVVVSDTISFMLWIDDDSYMDAKHKKYKITTISDRPLDMLVTRQGALQFLESEGEVYVWNRAPTKRPYLWVSEPVDAGFRFSLTRAKVGVEDHNAKVTLESAFGEVSRTFPPGEEIRPYNRLGRHKEYFVRIEGIGEVTEIVLGVSEKDISSRE